MSTKDSAIQVALGLEGEDLWNLCSTNKQLLNWICNNGQFWAQKIPRDFGINTQETLNRDATSEDYRFLYNIKDMDIPALNELVTKESKEGRIDHVRLLLKKNEDVHPNYDQALIWATENGHKDVVELLLKYGADASAVNDYALRWAARKGNTDVVRLLLENGADIHADDDGALIRAAESGHKMQ